MTYRFDELETVLAELRRRHRRLEAPAHLAEVLSTATNVSRSQPRRLIGWREWAIAAAILIAMVAWRANRTGWVNDRHPLHTNLVPAAESYPLTAKPAAATSMVSPTMAARVPVAAVPHKLTTEFVALPESASLPAPVETSVLQLQLQKGELRRYGFDIPPSSDAELVRADFVIGDDGLARAIRLVR